MPQLSGKEIMDLMKISVVLADVPVILISSDPVTHDRAMEIVQKPFKMTELLEHIERLLGIGGSGCQRQIPMSASSDSRTGDHGKSWL